MEQEMPSHEDLLNLRNAVEEKADEYGRYQQMVVADAVRDAVRALDRALDLHESVYVS